MNPNLAQHSFVMAMAKHLPPSSSQLRLVDLGGQAAPVLAQRRADLDVHALAENAAGSVDAVVAYDVELKASLLKRVWSALRPGGRFIAVLPAGQVSKSWVALLEKHDYVRILVEAADDGRGLLIRGEKPHHHRETRRRIEDIARADGDLLDLMTFKGRYVHLLIRQRPDKPIWKLKADESICWQALARQDDDGAVLLGFSSLPKAVGFMQPAILAGQIQNINKVGKFDKSQALDWPWPVILNPKPGVISIRPLVFVVVNPATAAAPDE